MLPLQVLQGGRMNSHTLTYEYTGEAVQETQNYAKINFNEEKFWMKMTNHDYCEAIYIHMSNVFFL